MGDEQPYPNHTDADHGAAPHRFAAPVGDSDATSPDRLRAAGTAQRVVHELLDGNRRFRSGLPRYGHDVLQAHDRAEQPSPGALVLGCIDSRVPPEAIFDQNFGDLLVVRTAGHVLDSAAVASIELAVAAMGVPLVVVLGHESCAAVAYAVDAVHRGERNGGALGYLVDQIAPSVPMDHRLSGTQTYQGAVRSHVASVVAAVRAIPAVARASGAGATAVVGMEYDVHHGEVEVTVPLP